MGRFSSVVEEYDVSTEVNSSYNTLSPSDADDRQSDSTSSISQESEESLSQIHHMFNIVQ